MGLGASYKDDLESLVYILLACYDPQLLPWLNRCDITVSIESQNKFMMEHKQLFWDSFDFFVNLPPLLAEFATRVNSLATDGIPDYDGMCQMIRSQDFTDDEIYYLEWNRLLHPQNTTFYNSTTLRIWHSLKSFKVVKREKTFPTTRCFQQLTELET